MLTLYKGQKQGYRLRDICDAGVQYATVSFVTTSPEHGDGYPVTNFGANCAAETFQLPNGGKSQLLSECHLIKEDIPYCQSKGVKVLLAIGGESGDYRVSTRAKGVEFGDFLYNAFGPYKDTWKGPRPFDNGDQHVSVDGFDLDLENSEVSKYITAHLSTTERGVLTFSSHVALHCHGSALAQAEPKALHHCRPSVCLGLREAQALDQTG